MKELYKTLKDHKNSFMQNLVHGSYSALFEEEMSNLCLDLDTADGSSMCVENVVRIVLAHKTFQDSLKVSKIKVGFRIMNEY